MKILEFRKRRSDSPFTAQELTWFDNLDNYRDDRTLEIVNDYNADNLHVAEMAVRIASLETIIMDLGHQALHADTDIERSVLADNLISEMDSEISKYSTSYRNNIRIGD